MKAVVIGGGPAGCAAAYVLARRGHDVTLLEAADRVGGRTKQLMRDGFSLNTGALFLMGGIYPRTMALLKEMGHERELVRWRGRAQLQDEDDSRYPVRFDSLASFFAVPRLTLGDRLRLILAGVRLYTSPGPANPFDGGALARFDQGDNLERWTRGNLGERNYEYVMRPIMDFLYAVPLGWLSTPFPLAIIQQAHKLGLSVPPGGIGQVSDWFVTGAPKLKSCVSTRVDRIERQANGYVVHAAGRSWPADGIVLATESFVAAELLRESIPAAAAGKLLQTPYTDYAHVAVAYAKNPWPDFPADLVLPVGAGGVRNVGALELKSRRHPGSVPAGAEAVGVYFNTPPLAHMSDDDIKREAVAATERAFGKAPLPTFVHLFRYDRGLTIAKPGHYAALDSVHKDMPPNIFLAGDYFSQAGVEAAVFSGELAALKLHQAGGSRP